MCVRARPRPDALSFQSESGACLSWDLTPCHFLMELKCQGGGKYLMETHYLISMQAAGQGGVFAAVRERGAHGTH